MTDIRSKLQAVAQDYIDKIVQDEIVEAEKGIEKGVIEGLDTKYLQDVLIIVKQELNRRKRITK